MAQTKIEKALHLHQSGQLAKAKAMYEDMLKSNPKYAEVWRLLGYLEYQTGNLPKAVELFSRAITIKPNVGQAYYNRATALVGLNQMDAALKDYDRAVELNPDIADVYFGRGFVLNELKQFEAAVQDFSMALQIDSTIAEAYLNRANALVDLNQTAVALEDYSRAIALKPNDPIFYVNRGGVLLKLSRYEEAMADYNRAIQMKPDLAEGYYNRGSLLEELHQFNAAIEDYNRAISLKPDYAYAYLNRAGLFVTLKQFDAAFADFDRAQSIHPTLPEIYYNRGFALDEINQLEEALINYEKTFAIKPDLDYLLGNLLYTKMKLCDWTNLDKNMSELISKVKKGEKCSHGFYLQFLVNSLSIQRKASQMWINDKHPANYSLGPIPKYPTSEKIRIGYFSADFRIHPVLILLVELFELHNKNRFELIAFSFGADTQDALRWRAQQAFDQFIDVRYQSDKAVAQLARELKIDIAIDLGGNTKGSRPGVFAYRAAPIQVGYIGYLGTMGADYFDYLIADQTIIPSDAQQHYAEKIVYLPSFQANDSKRVIANKTFTKQELGLPDEGFVFCSFNSNYKIMPSIFALWMRILKAVNGSVLFLFAENKMVEQNLKKEAEAAGVDAGRVIFGGRLERSEYLARFKVADLFLDTFPYNAGATASDALWAGLPLLTLTGETFASRVAASLLTAIELPELITHTQEDYESLAIELAMNPAKLHSIKTKLAANRSTAPLFNTPLFTKHLEEAYVQMLERYRAGLKPDHIYIKH